ncbi:zinc ribbon domain-containing protein [Saezia sanguinis]|uniref:zinc ribbon domain-containing protein n=1 Tax=Saezia sanguinis TaxID=1965230 RepID=UPI00306536CA
MALINCPECNKEVSDKAETCPNCGIKINTNTTTIASAGNKTLDLGILLLVLPVIGILLIWFWVGSMNLLQSPKSTLNLIAIIVLIGTAVAAALEVRSAIQQPGSKKNPSDPITWVFLIALLWVIGYPLYLHKRKLYGRKGMLLAGIVLMVLFAGSYLIMNAAINEQIAKLQNIFGR